MARAVVRCPVPVWTAIGHATDRTLADLVANRACATPSAAAAGMIESDGERRRWDRLDRARGGECRNGGRVRAAWIVPAVMLLVLADGLIGGFAK